MSCSLSLKLNFKSIPIDKYFYKCYSKGKHRRYKVMYYTIGEVAKMFNLTPSTIRYYDKEGLTPFVKKDENGVRKYTEEDLEWIRLLMNLRDIDMPISNIKEYIQLYLQGDKTIDERRDLMCRYTEYIKKKIENTINNLEMAIRKLNQYDSAVADILDDKDLFEFNKK